MAIYTYKDIIELVIEPFIDRIGGLHCGYGDVLVLVANPLHGTDDAGRARPKHLQQLTANRRQSRHASSRDVRHKQLSSILRILILELLSPNQCLVLAYSRPALQIMVPKLDFKILFLNLTKI